MTTPKIYKEHKHHLDPIPTWPVCSDITSLLHGLGKCIDYQLQLIVTSQPSNFRDCFALKETLDSTVFPLGTLLATSDATSMSANIDTNAALSIIGTLFTNHFDHHNPTQALMISDAVDIVFCNNIVKFGNTFSQQQWHSYGHSTHTTIWTLICCHPQTCHPPPLDQPCIILLPFYSQCLPCMEMIPVH